MSWVFVDDLKRAFASLIYSVEELLLFDPPELKIIGNMSVFNQINVFSSFALLQLTPSKITYKIFLSVISSYSAQSHSFTTHHWFSRERPFSLF